MEAAAILGLTAGIFALLAMILIGWAIYRQRNLKNDEPSNNESTQNSSNETTPSDGKAKPERKEVETITSIVVISRAAPPYAGGINSHGRRPFRHHRVLGFGARGMRNHFNAIRY